MGYSIMNNDVFGPGNWDGITKPYPPFEMSGFLKENNGHAESMHQFSPEQVPVKTFLA